MNAAPRWLYLHGFASGPESTKGRALAAHYAQRGIHLTRLDLRVPSLEHLRLSRMIEHVRERMGASDVLGGDRTILFGSSLGGLTACRLAEGDPRVVALVLLAPAFRIVERWRTRLGEAKWEAWRRSGWIETKDYVTGGIARVDFGFAEDAAAIESRGDGWPDVKVPTLIVHGVRDDVAPIALSRRWRQGRPHVQLVEVDDGHELTTSLDVIARKADEFLAEYIAPFASRP